MRRIVVSEFMSVDGVMEDPGGAEGFDRGGWAFQFDRGSEGDKFKLDEVMDAEAMLLGRVTYEGFAAAWPERTDDAGFADKMNSMQKFVVSNTLQSADWNNSTIVSGDVIAGILHHAVDRHELRDDDPAHAGTSSRFRCTRPPGTAKLIDPRLRLRTPARYRSRYRVTCRRW